MHLAFQVQSVKFCHYAEQMILLATYRYSMPV